MPPNLIYIMVPYPCSAITDYARYADLCAHVQACLVDGARPTDLGPGRPNVGSRTKSISLSNQIVKGCPNRLFGLSAYPTGSPRARPHRQTRIRIYVCRSLARSRARFSNAQQRLAPTDTSTWGFLWPLGHRGTDRMSFPAHPESISID